MGNIIKTNLHKCVLATLFLCFGLVSCDSYYENLVLEGQMLGKWYNEELTEEKHVYNEYEFYHNGGWIFTSVENDSVVVKTDKGYYSYFLRGKVISESQIQIHDFIIHIDYLPKDILAGEYVSCQCLRLDLGE